MDSGLDYDAIRLLKVEAILGLEPESFGLTLGDDGCRVALDLSGNRLDGGCLLSGEIHHGLEDGPLIVVRSTMGEINQ